MCVVAQCALSQLNTQYDFRGKYIAMFSDTGDKQKKLSKVNML